MASSFPTDWKRRCKLTIQNSEVDVNISSFPVLLTESCLPVEMFDESGSNNAQNGGGDIRFSSDVDGVTRIGCEIVSFHTTASSAASGAEIYVKVNILDASDVDIWVWYNTDETDSQPAIGAVYGTYEVWEDLYYSVYHMDGSGTAIANSAGSHSPMTKKAKLEPTEVDGKIGKAQHFDGSGDEVLCSSPQVATITDTQISWEAWVKSDDGGSGAVEYILHIQKNGLGQCVCHRLNPSNIMQTVIRKEADLGLLADLADQAVANNVWEHYFSSANTDTDLYIYRNGGNEQSTTGAAGGIYDSDGTNAISIGYRNDISSQYFDGMIDEIRIHKNPRTGTWVSTSYNNQNDPGSFTIASAPEANWKPNTLTLIENLTYRTGTVADAHRILNRDGDIWVFTANSIIATVDISPTGDIAAALTDQWDSPDVGFNFMDFKQCGSGNFHVFFYAGAGNDGYVGTCSIATDGTITESWEDNWEFDVTTGRDNSTIHISGDIYANWFQGANADGWVKTFTVDDAGAITESFVSSEEFDINTGLNPDAIHVSGDIYAHVYNGGASPYDDMILMTYDIDSAGNITATPEDSWIFAETDFITGGITAQIYHVSGDTYAIIHQNDTSGGVKVFTFTMANDGTITKSEIDSETFSDGSYFSGAKKTFHMLPLANNYWMIAYQDDATWDIRIRTMKIAEGGTISEFSDASSIDTAGTTSTTPGVFTIELSQTATTVYIALAYGNNDGITTRNKIQTLSFDDSVAPAGWTGIVDGVTNPAAVHGVLAANIASVIGVT